MPSKLQSYAEDFSNFAGIGLIKEAYIRKIPGGRWRVFSENGKNLGTYNSESAAKKRLRQIHFFKWKKASDEEDKEVEKLPNGEQVSYSSVMRFLNKNYDEQSVRDFQKRFKDNFDRLYLEGQEEPEVEALEMTLKEIEPLKKQAAALDLGNPITAGNYLANLARFMLSRIDEKNRKRALASLKKKIYFINEYSLAAKKLSKMTPIGTSISLIKNLLMEQNSQYIRAVLNSIVKAL